MKTLFRTLFSFSLLALLSTQIYAQATTIMRPAVAFVEAVNDTTSRNILYIKQPDSAVQSYDIGKMIRDTGALGIDSIRQLAVIGMTPSGDGLVLAGSVSYDQGAGNHTTFQGIFYIPWPLTSDNLLARPIKLLFAPPSVVGFHPVGTLSADGTQWWATFSGQSLGGLILTFYHGRTDGTGTIDSATVQQPLSGGTALPAGVQVSNIVMDKSNHDMLAMVADGINSGDQGQDFDALICVWHSPYHSDIQVDDIGAVYHSEMDPIFTHQLSSTQSIDFVDSGFGLTVLPTNNNSAKVLAGFIPHTKQDIEFDSISYNGTPDLSSLGPTIPHSIIPSTQYFFAGLNCKSVGYNEDIVGQGAGQNGNGGDMSVNSIGGDSVLFITHESSGGCGNRKANSAIWMYDLTNGGSGTATLIYNDSSAQELQPVWVVTPYTVPAVVHDPGIAWQLPKDTSFGVVDTGKSGNLMLTVVDTSQVNVTIDSAHIGGQNASSMTLTPLSYPIPLSPNQTKTFTVTFTSAEPAGLKKAALKVYFEGATHDSLSQQITGTVNIPTNSGGSVAEDPALAASITTLPNPFSSSVTVQIVSPDMGPLSVLVHDAMGRTVYRSETRETAAGATQNFSFDAKTLGLANGIYYVTAFLGDRQASREVVYQR